MAKHKDQSFIVCNSKFIEINWPKVVLWSDDAGLKMKPGTYYDYSGKPDRKPNIFVNHWDVCLSAESCAKVLNRRGISVHFCIDNDGTIYQLLDTQHGAWHAGNVHGNKQGIGVEISNAYYTKYQNWYVKNGFGERPIESTATVHGVSMKPFLGFYPVQVEALKELWKSISHGVGIPLVCPVDKDGMTKKVVDNDVARGKFSGFVNHYNYTKNKIDCANLDLVSLLADIEGKKS